MAALARCVGDVEAFLADHFTARPHLKRGDGDRFADLLAVEHVDEILTTRSPRAPAFRLVRDGEVLPTSSYTRSGTVGGKRVGDLPDVGRIFAHFDDGATVVLQGLHRYWEPITRFCRDLEERLTHPVQANAYLTPPGAEGLDVHHDTHDVFALQTHGTKRWVIHDPVVEQPLASQSWRSEEHEAGDPVLDVALAPGDCLYVPRGTPHAAATVNRASLHLTIGVRATTWHDVFRRLVDTAGDELAFREALPVGFARDPATFARTLEARLKEMADFVAASDVDELAEAEAARFWSSRRPLLRGQLLDLLALHGDSDVIDDDTVVARRPGVVCHLGQDETGDLTLDLGDRRVRLPPVAEPAVRRVLDQERMSVGALDDLLDPDSRLVLIHRLVREGLLTVARPDTEAPRD